MQHSGTKQISPDISIEQEKDADREALACYFEGHNDSNSAEYILRAHGVINAIYGIMLPSFFDGCWGASTHPPSWNRMERLLSQLDIDDCHPAFVYAAELKALYLGFSNQSKGGRYESPAASMENLYESCSQGAVGDPQLTVIPFSGPRTN